MDQQLRVGEVVHGKVVKVMPFGAFVELDRGPTGLLLVTEIVPQPIGDRGYPNVSDIITARITVIDGPRIGLTQRNPHPMIEQDSERISD